MRVTVNNLTFAYFNKIILKDLSFNLKSGDFLLVHGRNGTGKSTLIKCLLKINKVANNTIFLDDIDINNIKRFYNIGFVLDFDSYYATKYKHIKKTSKSGIFCAFFRCFIFLSLCLTLCDNYAIIYR